MKTIKSKSRAKISKLNQIVRCIKEIEKQLKWSGRRREESPLMGHHYAARRDNKTNEMCITLVLVKCDSNIRKV